MWRRRNQVTPLPSLSRHSGARAAQGSVRNRFIKYDLNRRFELLSQADLLGLVSFGLSELSDPSSIVFGDPAVNFDCALSCLQAGNQGAARQFPTQHFEKHVYLLGTTTSHNHVASHENIRWCQPWLLVT